MGTKILSKKKIEQRDINEFNKLIVKQKIYNKLFMTYTSEDFTKQYRKILSRNFLEDVENIRNTILNLKQNKKFINVNDWFDIVTIKIDKLKRL